MPQDNGAGSRNGVKKKPRRGTGYPDRTPFFFHRFVRLLIKTCAAMVIGADGCFLCTVVAATEDSARYRYAVRFYNSQLAQLCGWSIDKLDRVRRRCIYAGFLHYEPGGNRTPGLYWVLVDDSHGDAPDLGPIGELDSDFEPHSAELPADNSATEPGESSGEPPEKSTELTSLSLSNNSPPPPPAVNGASSVSGSVGDADPWAKVEERLISSGVSDWRGVLRSFRETGCSAQHGLELIDFWEQHRDRFESPVGALHHRLRNAHPSIAVSGGWPGLQKESKPKLDFRADIERFKGKWSHSRPSRRAELAKQAQVDLSGFEGRALDELPVEVATQLVRVLTGETTRGHGSAGN